MSVLKFTVDAKLLRELGERLVGRPHIALAELIKNSYDADARNVEISFTDNSITVSDDGHGMNDTAFIQRWMRIGNTLKIDDRVSPALGRPLTGSKGVGRLSAQLLAGKLALTSVALKDKTIRSIEQRRHAGPEALDPEIRAFIDWPTAWQEKDLTDVTVDFTTSAPTTHFIGSSRCGTIVELTSLSDEWQPESFAKLAQEIWALQPPFQVDPDSETAFIIALKTPYPDVQRTFDEQMSAILDIARARITGKLMPVNAPVPAGATRLRIPDHPTLDSRSSDVIDDTPAELERPENDSLLRDRDLLITLQLSGSPRRTYVVTIPDCRLYDVDFEIRVFDLKYRQPKGIRVDIARQYLAAFGGVSLYDNGFRLPYYGPDIDWLRLELDHARRLSRSSLLPEELQMRNAMLDLPTNTRVFGAVNISTSVEQRMAEAEGRKPSDALAIQITRDRLVDNAAFSQLTQSTRLSIDLYALEHATAKSRGLVRKRGKPRPDSSVAIKTASQVVETLKDQLPDEQYSSLRDAIDTVADDANAMKEEARAFASLLGALATAGMTSLAYEHEISKQRAQVRTVARKLRAIAAASPAGVAEPLVEQAEMLAAWATRADRIRALFRPLLDEESRVAVEKYNAFKLASDVTRQMEVLARGTNVDVSGLPVDLQLPSGGYAAWSAILQNLLTNAFRATLHKKPARVRIDGGMVDGRGWLRLQDNGEGLDLHEADRLFLPFERGVEPSAKSEALGLGGSGLGLTIVRMMTDEIGCEVLFAQPDPGWSTAVRIEWKG